MSPFRIETFLLGISNLWRHKLRALLTALGIIFGVAAVICMLSISEGASADELRLINALGTRNIIITSIKPGQETQMSEGTKRMLEYGITRADHELIAGTIPHTVSVVPLREVSDSVYRHAKRFHCKVAGTTPEFFKVVNASVGRGRLLAAEDLTDKKQTCVIGDEVRKNLFGYDDPIGQTIFVERFADTQPYEVVGVLAAVQTAGAPARGVEERDLNREVMIPLATAETRYSDVTVRRSSGTFEAFTVELSGLYVTVDSIENVLAVADMVRRVFAHNHEIIDYDIRVPLARLRLAEKKKRFSQLLLGFIAGSII